MTKNQHYVPRFYLRNFTAGDGYLWVYDIQNKRIKEVTPESICAEKYLYETQFEHANEKMGKFVVPNEIENIFSRYEGQFSNLIKRIQEICVSNQNKNALILNTSEKDMLISSIVNLFLRNPRNMEKLKLSELREEVHDFEEYNEIDDLLNCMKIGGTESIFLAAQKKNMLTKENPDSFPERMEKRLSNLDFMFFYAQECTFLTSDMPVLIGNDRHTIDSDSICAFLALTPTVAVFFGNYSQSKENRNRMVSIKSDIVNRFNLQLFEKAQYSMRRWIISPSKSQIETYFREVE